MLLLYIVQNYYVSRSLLILLRCTGTRLSRELKVALVPHFKFACTRCCQEQSTVIGLAVVRHDTVITSHFVMQMNVFGLYIKIIYFCSSHTQPFYTSECAYRSFATRVSQLKIWHFWVTGIERNVCRCTFNRYSVIRQFAKLAAGEQLCRRCTHRKFQYFKTLKSLSWKITHFELWHCCCKWVILQLSSP